jgi:hypothetical protein
MCSRCCSAIALVATSDSLTVFLAYTTAAIAAVAAMAANTALATESQLSNDASRRS